jgi:hypothetical protein
MSCEEFLEELQLCLHTCNNNKRIYHFTERDIPIDIAKCESVIQYKNSMHATNTIIRFDAPILYPSVKYAVEYNVAKRLLTVSTDSDRK